ncbi:MAG: hypothetical protein WA133_12305 [Syntrophales bacterium]
MKVVVLHGQVEEGAAADEQDVLVQVGCVSQALTRLGYEPVPLVFSLNMDQTAAQLQNLQPAFVFNLVEGIAGRGSLIACAPLLLDTLSLPYTGVQAEAMFLTSGKLTAKKILRAAGIATPDFLTFDAPLPSEQAENRFIVKAVWEHASLGLDESAVFCPAEPGQVRQKILALQQHLGGPCFAEVFIEGREFNVSLLGSVAGPTVLPPAEIIFVDYPRDKVRMVCYRAKWMADSFEYGHTCRSFAFPGEDEPLLTQLAELSVRCWQLFGLRGYARVDFRVDEAGRPWVLEVNANPCISLDGGFVAAAAQAGLDYQALIDRIIRDLPPQDTLC